MLAVDALNKQLQLQLTRYIYLGQVHRKLSVSKFSTCRGSRRKTASSITRDSKKMLGSSSCGLELSLSLSCGSGRDESSETSNSSSWIHRDERYGPQQITILYNGRICVFNVTELQARDILSMAKQEMENSTTKNKLEQQQQCPTNYEGVGCSSSPSPSLSSPHKAVAQKLFSPELSMKRSLQRFLQKRKSRIDSVSPYNYTTNPLPFVLESSQT